MEPGLRLAGMQTSRPFLNCEALSLCTSGIGRWEHKEDERAPALHTQGFLTTYPHGNGGVLYFCKICVKAALRGYCTSKIDV